MKVKHNSNEWLSIVIHACARSASYLNVLAVHIILRGSIYVILFIHTLIVFTPMCSHLKFIIHSLYVTEEKCRKVPMGSNTSHHCCLRN